MRRVYLIDLENVQSAGLEGVDQLTEEDSIYIFYSDKADNLKIDLVRKMQESPAKVDFIKANNGTPNALDFQLISYLFYHLEKDVQYWIVSKDTGYDAAIKMGKRMGLMNVRRAPAIKNAVHFGIRANKIAAYRAAKEEEKEDEEILDEQTEKEADISEEQVEKEPEEVSEAQATEEPTLEKPEEEAQQDSEEAEVFTFIAPGVSEKKKEKTTSGENETPAGREHETQSGQQTSYRETLMDILNHDCNVATDPETVNLVEDGLRKCSNKGQFYQFFRRRMGAARGSAFYKSLRSQFDTMKKLVNE